MKCNAPFIILVSLSLEPNWEHHNEFVWLGSKETQSLAAVEVELQFQVILIEKYSILQKINVKYGFFVMFLLTLFQFCN